MYRFRIIQPLLQRMQISLQAIWTLHPFHSQYNRMVRQVHARLHRSYGILLPEDLLNTLLPFLKMLSGSSRITLPVHLQKLQLPHRRYYRYRLLPIMRYKELQSWLLLRVHLLHFSPWILTLFQDTLPEEGPSAQSEKFLWPELRWLTEVPIRLRQTMW